MISTRHTVRTGQRAFGVRLGIVYPGGGAEQEYYQFAELLPGLRVYLVFSKRTDMSGNSHRLSALRKTARVANLIEAARRLASLRPDAVMWACTSGSFVLGRKYAETQVRAIRQIVAAPTSSTSLAFVSALRHMRLRRVSIAASYPPATARAFATFLDQFNIEACAVKSLGLRDGLLSSRLSPAQVVQFARKADVPSAEALLVPDTALPSLGIIGKLEREIGKPVLGANHVTLWEGLRLAGMHPMMKSLGHLFTLAD